MSGIPQGSVLGLVLFNVFVENMDCGIECTLRKSANNTEDQVQVPAPGCRQSQAQIQAGQRKDLEQP